MRSQYPATSTVKTKQQSQETPSHPALIVQERKLANSRVRVDGRQLLRQEVFDVN